MQDQGQAAGDRKWWHRAADGQTIFRRMSPVVFWWAWLVFAVIIVVQAAISEHDYLSVEIAAGLAAVTAVVYATTLRPRVMADDRGVTVCNPFRDHQIGWGGLKAVYLGDSVELSCARLAPHGDKTVYCWALYTGRRSSLRAKMRAERSRTSGYGGGYGSGRVPAAAQELATQDTVKVMAAEINRRSADAQQNGAPAALLQSTWAWWPAALVVAPAAVLLALILAR